MKVHSITIDNCKSYKNRESFSLEDDITLLVGPNAGGKSNTMDILSIVLRKYFLQSYTIYEGEDAGIRVQDIHKHELFHPISDWLDKNSERAEQPQRIELVLEVGATDVDNIKTILNNKEKFIGALKKYRNRRTDKLEFLDSWDTEMFVVGNKVKFTIQDHEIVCSSDLGDKFREYLQYLNLFILLARDLDNVILAPTFLYFSPYRSAGTEDLNVTLASDNYINLLHQYFQTTSRGTTSLIKLATVFFAEKKRRMEERASKNGYGKAWDEDEDVSLTKKYLKHLGYGWDLKLVDGSKNIYEIELLRNGRKFSISKASSGGYSGRM